MEPVVGSRNSESASTQINVENLTARSRWDGVLSEEEFQYCLDNDIAMSYDCAQIGWVVFSDEEETSDGTSAHDDQTKTKRLQEMQSIQQAFFQALDEITQAPNSGDMDPAQLHKKAMEFSRHYEDELLTDKSWQSLDHCHLTLLKILAEKMRQLYPAEDDANLEDMHYRPWREEDVNYYIKILGNPKVWNYLPEDYPGPFTEELAKDFIALANMGEHHTILAIEFQGKAIGQMRLMYNTEYPEIKTAEVAYLLSEDYWGQGKMSGILQDFTNKIMIEKNLDFIYAWIRADHPASIKSAERANYFRDEFEKEDEIAKQYGRVGFKRYISY